MTILQWAEVVTYVIVALQIHNLFTWKPIRFKRNGALTTRLRFMAMSVFVVVLIHSYGTKTGEWTILICCLLMLGQYSQHHLLALWKHHERHN